MILSPSILSADFARLGEQIKMIENAGVTWLHIDVMDGWFVPNISFGLPVIRSLRKATELFFDVHLMIGKTEQYLERFLDAGADSVTVHLESVKDMRWCIDTVRAKGKKICIALSPDTPVENVYPYLDQVDMVLIMTVYPGYGGQVYMEAMDAKIKKLREYAGPDYNIQVDGGICMDNIHHVTQTGANVIVAGSAVFQGDLDTTIRSLVRTAEGADE